MKLLADEFGLLAQLSSARYQLPGFCHGLARLGDQFARREHIRLGVRNFYSRAARSIGSRSRVRHASYI